MKSIIRNSYVRVILTCGVYFLFISVILLELNTIAFSYVDLGGKVLYVVMAEHFIISIIFGYFWLNLSNIKSKYTISSILILPISFFTVMLLTYNLTEQKEDNELIVIGLLIFSQLSGVLTGSIANNAIANN